MCRLYELVGPFVGEDDFGREALSLFLCEPRISHNDDDVAWLNEASGSTIQANGPRATFPYDSIGLEPCPIVVVYNLYTLPGQDASSVHQVLVYGDAPYIVEVGFRNPNPVYF